MRQEEGLKKKLTERRPVTGVVVPGHWPELVEIIGHLGYDFVQIDMEHGALSMMEAANLVRAAETAGISPIGRVPYNEPHHIMRFLDAGMKGVVIPHVSSRAEAQAAVSAAYYYPLGKRGLGGVRASGFGALYTLQEFVTKTNTETIIVILLETQQGLKNLDGILQVPEVDVVAIGHNDLAHSLGKPGDSEAPEVQKAIALAMEKIRQSHAVLGLGASNGYIARRNIEEHGAGYIIVQMTQLLINGATELLAGT